MTAPASCRRLLVPALVLPALLALTLPARAAAQHAPVAPPSPSPTPAPQAPSAAPAAHAGASTALPGDAVLLTVFLRHDQSKTLDEIEAHLDRTGFRKTFPPEGVEVVSWYVMMGVGQVVTLRVPPSKLRTVNVALERGVWGAFRTDFYPTYDFRPVWEEQKRKALQR